jgi:signal transduction histidine kinase
MRRFGKTNLARFNKVQNKIFVPFIVLMLVIGTLTIYVMTDLVLSNVETRIDDKLRSDARLIQEFISDMEKSLAFYAQFIADTEKLAGHISEARDSRLILIYVLDFLRENKISSNIGGPRTPMDSSVDLNRMGMLGIRTTGLLARSEGKRIKLSLSAVAPIERRMSSRSVVTVSREMDRDFLQELADKTGAYEIHIYYKNKLIESSSPDDQCKIKAREFLTPEILERTLKGGVPFLETFSCGDHSFKMTLVPLSVNFKKEALVGIFESMDDLVEARSNIILSTIVVVGLMFLIIVPIYILTVSYTVAPIRELSKASRAVAEGNLDHYVPVRTGDEVGELTASFNSMVSDLKRYRDDLEQWNQTLEQRVAARSRELAETQAQLIQSTKLAAVGELAAGIAHELNNPLAGIYAFLQVFVQTLRSRGLRELSEEEAQGFQENLVHVEREIRRCKSIIGSLLTFARVSEKQYGPIQLNGIIEDTLSFMRNNLVKSGVKLETHFEEGLPLIMGDANELQQVFLNIVVNARKAMADSGRLTITTWLEKDKNMLCSSIEDTGTGIDPEMLDKIFNPFFSTSKPGEGTGLGLSISYGIVKDHGGKISVDSRPGQGATFTVSLPIAGEFDREGAPASREPVASGADPDIEAV